MKVYRLNRKQKLPISLQEAWPFFSTPRNLESITPAFLKFRITSSVPNDIHSGLIISYRIAAVAGIPMTWVTEIKHVDAPYRFVDEQRVGPFRFWYHEHCFRETDGGIEMEDTVYYAMPFGWIGRLVHALFIRARLEAIFDFRRIYLDRHWRKRMERVENCADQPDFSATSM
ncbi:SRPBCC family protein [Methylocaldum sp.]|uniref:SRPBCC family protein n=1 Tax=Methylocaldum sp. TaxID=1969727 RepID=UPI002D2F0A83|nr:SRPBCC family protein [Methylocaldum sp.]HYE34568.1 SRPBCC family protein [Methylocaldum sp.]